MSAHERKTREREARGRERCKSTNVCEHSWVCKSAHERAMVRCALPGGGRKGGHSTVGDCGTYTGVNQVMENDHSVW
jgi:hypothetical protein